MEGTDAADKWQGTGEEAWRVEGEERKAGHQREAVTVYE